MTLDVQSKSLFVLQASKGPIEWESNSWSDVTRGFSAYTPSNQELLCRDVANKAMITMIWWSRFKVDFFDCFFFFFFFFGSWLFQLEGCMELSPSNWLSVQSNALFVLQAGKGPIEWESNSWSAVTWGFLAFIPSEIKSYYKGSPSLVYHRVMQLFTTLIIYNCSRNSGNWHLGLFSKPLLIVIIIIVTVPCSWACRAWFFIVVIAAVRRATAVWENGVAG